MMNKILRHARLFQKTVILLTALCLFPITPILSQAKFSLTEIKKEFISSESLLLDRNGQILHELRTNPMERKIHWIPLENISQNLQDMILLAEDKRFFEHEGVDYWALGGGILRFLSFGTPRGASTITMQLATILDATLKGRGQKTISQKWRQIQFAKDLEKNLSKEEILECYLNLVSFRGELVGIDAVSKGYFRKEAHGLTENESILIASMIKNPSFTNQRLIQRACFLYEKKNNTEDCSPIKELANHILGQGIQIKPSRNFAPHLARKLLNREIKSFQTTLDIKIQKVAIQTLNERLFALQKQNVHDGSILIVENYSGDVLAYVASSSEFSKSSEMDGILAKRQAGSTLKPFTFALGFQKKIITPASILEDEPIQIQVGNGIYNPGNYQGKFHGLVTARTALASSLNVPAVRVLDLVGVENFVDHLGEIGFKDLRDADFYGLSIALGSLDITLWDLVKAYRVLANSGMYGEIGYSIEKKDLKTQIYSKEIAYMLTDILSDRVARSPTFGLENSLSTKYPSAVKTGTSKDMRDNWCVGYTDKYTVGVWVGNFSGESMWNVSGVSGAAPIFSDLINYLHKNTSIPKKSLPENIVKIKVKNPSGDLYEEIFLKGTESDVSELAKLEIINSIKYPIDNMIIAIDPDIPKGSQIVRIETMEKHKDHSLYLNNQRIGNAHSPVNWFPIIGKHKLELKNEKGERIDKIRFEVR